jgi:hypothetical protein
MKRTAPTGCAEDGTEEAWPGALLATTFMHEGYLKLVDGDPAELVAGGRGSASNVAPTDLMD